MNKLVCLLILLFSFSILSAQEKLSEKEKERRENNIQSGNPFKKFGYKAKVATLSKGKYLEFHDLDSIVTIGTVRWHVNKNLIVGRIVPDSLNPDTQPIGDRAGRWISPDPLSEEFPSWSPYNMCYDNPVKFVDPDGREADDIVFRGKDNNELRIKTAGEDKVINVPFNVGSNKTIDMGIGNIDPSRFVYGYIASGDVGVAIGIGAHWGGEVSVANFSDNKYSGYNYVYGGSHVNKTVGGQLSLSASIGGSVFVGYNDSKDILNPSSFEGKSYSYNVSADIKDIVGGGISVAGFSSVKNPISQKGWKGFSLGINIGVGASGNAGSIGRQDSNTFLLNDIKPTSQRGIIDRASNKIAPIKSSIIQSVYNKLNP